MALGLIRVIGGTLRGRKIKVPPVADLRPTTDQVRETLFNWLAPVILNARCLDLFAGSGALGFEAISRGAASVLMIEKSRECVDVIRSEIQNFKVDQVEVYQTNIPHGLKKPDVPFDIIFIDPPYSSNLLLPTLFYLADHAFLAADGFVYLESNREISETELPPQYKIVKHKKTGQVHYHLAQHQQELS